MGSRLTRVGFMRVILCIGFTGPRDVHITGKTLFLGVSIRMFAEEISIWTRTLRNDCLHQWEWASSNLLRGQIKQKGSKRANILLLLKLRLCLLLPSDIGTPGSQAFGLGCGLILSIPRFSALQTQTTMYIIFSCGPQAFQFGLEPHHQLFWPSSLHIVQLP